MVEQRPPARLFTVEEANRLLPEVRVILQELQRRRQRIQKLEAKKAVEELSWLREDGSVSPRAQQALERFEQTQRKELKGFENGLEEMGRLGAQLKDLDEGLVDFFARRGKELVYLCWKDGEERIRFWHDLESGFAGRRPIEELV